VGFGRASVVALRVFGEHPIEHVLGDPSISVHAEADDGNHLDLSGALVFHSLVLESAGAFAALAVLVSFGEICDRVPVAVRRQPEAHQRLDVGLVELAVFGRNSPARAFRVSVPHKFPVEFPR
jgi:hypothetical protein